MKKAFLVFFPLLLPFTLFFSKDGRFDPVRTEKGTLSIYFLDEQVGYEEYSWEEGEIGYSLTVRGRMTKPIAIEIERLEIYLDKSFIPRRYFFRGRVSGIDQEIRSVFSGGRAVNTKRVGGLEQTETVEIRRDAFLLPNPVFAPYMVLTKKFRCNLEERIDLSAYIIPQMEVSAILEPMGEAPCKLRMSLGQTQIEMDTDDEGTLLKLTSQNLKVVRTQVGVPIR